MVWAQDGHWKLKHPVLRQAARQPSTNLDAFRCPPRVRYNGNYNLRFEMVLVGWSLEIAAPLSYDHTVHITVVGKLTT